MIDVANTSLKRSIYEIVKEKPGICAREIFKIYNKYLEKNKIPTIYSHGDVIKTLCNEGYLRRETELFTNNLGKNSVRGIYFVAKEWPEQKELNFNHYSWDWFDNEGKFKGRYGIVS